MSENKEAVPEKEKALEGSMDQSGSVTIQVKPVNRRSLSKIAGEFGFGLGIILVTVTLYFVAGVFPDYVPISTANDLLNIMISTDGFCRNNFRSIIVINDGSAKRLIPTDP